MVCPRNRSRPPRRPQRPLPLREWAEVQESPWEVGELIFSRDFVFHWQYRIFEIEKELKDAPDDHKSFVHLQDDPY